MKPSLIVHGGAWDIPDEAVEACNSGCQCALTAGWSIPKDGGTALDAVEAAIIVLEDDPALTRATAHISISTAASNATPSSWTAPR